MIQCLACEVRSSRLYLFSSLIKLSPQDWFHESCCNLRERPSSRVGSPDPQPEQMAQAHEVTDDDAVSEASSSGLPPPLISGFEYESFVCGSCVFESKLLKKWAGTPGITMVIRDGPKGSWKAVDGEPGIVGELIDVDNSLGNSTAGIKRPHSPSNIDVPEAKRARGTSVTPVPRPSPCLAPRPNPIAEKIFANYKVPNESSLGTGDIFLSEGFRDRWCRCASVGISAPCSNSCGFT